MYIQIKNFYSDLEWKRKIEPFTELVGDLENRQLDLYLELAGK